MGKKWSNLFVIYILFMISVNCAQIEKSTSKDATGHKDTSTSKAAIAPKEAPTSKNDKPDIDEKKLKEIAEIRKNLNEAFEKDIDLKTSDTKGVVVQPKWTQDDDAKNKSTKVVVTDKRLKDTAAIRQEIQKAVSQNTYVTGEAFNATAVDQYLGIKKDKSKLNIVGSQGPVVQPEWTQIVDDTEGYTKVIITEENLRDTAAIRDEINSAIMHDSYAGGDPYFSSQADHYLGLKHRSKNILSAMLGSTADNFEEEEVGFGLDEETEPGAPNVVDSNALEDDIDLDKLRQLESTSRRTREVLILREIIEDLSFDLGEDVKEWEHFMHNGQEYFIGLRDKDLLIVQKDDMKYEKAHVITVGEPISYLDTFSFWNTETKQQEGLILVAVDEKVLWYQANKDEVFWQWSVGVPIRGLRYFKIEEGEYLAISSDKSFRNGYSSMNIYQFDVLQREFWIAQKLQLNDSCSEVSFMDTGRDVVLAVVQNNSAVIFTFNPRSEKDDRIKFEIKSTVISEGIRSVSGFQMGGYSYLALGGMSPQILHYTHGQFEPKTILGQNFGLVEMFLPVPARTYRDDLILLVQHRVDFDSHSLVVLETLIWNGDVFEATPPAPCLIGDHTFGYGVGCMLDIQREDGIKGAAILKRNKDIFIIVPRHKTESGLFQLKIELLPKNSELLDLKEIFAFLQDWVKEQDDLVEEAYKFLQETSDDSNERIDFSHVTSLKVPELDFTGDIGQIFVNDEEFTEKDLLVDLEDLIGAIERLDMELMHDDELVRHRRELSYDTLDFDNVEAEELQLQLLNGQQSYVKSSELIFNGAVTLDSLKVLDDIRLSSARFARDDSIEIDEDIDFDAINGIVWKDLMKDLVMRDNPLDIEELQVNGEVIVEEDATLGTLNGLNFPDDYLWSSGPPASVVQAEKIFLGSLTANAVDTGGLINDVNPFDLITLSEPEDVPGLTVFTQLEVSEKMEVNGVVQGRGLTDFLSNPSLVDSNIIHSACTFQHLEVKGPIRLSEDFNGKNLDDLLSDVVYRPTKEGEKITIKSQKSFNTVIFDSDLEIRDNSVSGIPLQSFVTKNTEQEFDIQNIIGNVYFNNLTIAGLYDSVDVNQLAKNSVNLFPDQTVDAEIEFTDDVWADSIEIVGTLNGQKGFKTLQDDLELDEASFEEVNAETLTAKCDINGDGTLNNVKMKGRAGNHSSALYVDELILESGLYAESLQNLDAKILLSFLEKIDNIPTMIMEGKILVDHIHVDGDVQVNKVNGQSFDEEILLSVIWLDRPNFLQTNVEFLNPLVINGNLRINGSLNELDFPRLVDDIAFKSESPLVIKSPKTFTAGFEIMGDATMESVNGLPFTEIATKQTIETFQGEIHINGDLIVKSLEITGYLNDFPIGGFGKSFRYDEELKTIVLLGKVAFEGPTNLENLYINGQLNSIGNVNEFFENIVYRNNICVLKGKTTFTGNVTIEKGAYIKALNGYNVMQLMKNIVFINDPNHIVITAPVIFSDVVEAKEVNVKGHFNTTNLMGCPLAEWMQDTLRLDQATDITGLLHFAPGVLDGNSMHMVFLNGMDMDYVVALNKPQTINVHVNFSDIYLTDSITTGGLVNGVDLKREMENTLMINGDQHITTPLTMQSCTVVGSLETHNLVNEAKDLRNLANLHEDLDFNSPMFFSKVSVKNVITDDLISGIDFNQWHQYSLWTEGRKNMVVTGNWSIKDLYVQSPSAIPLVNGMTMDHIRRNLTKPYDEMHDQYDRIYEAYSGLCQRSKVLFAKAQNRIYFVKHFERAFSLEEDHDINGVFSIIDGDRTYLIVNIECESRIYLWSADEEVFKMVSDFDSGVIKEIVALPGKEDALHFVTNMRSRGSRCSRVGVNSWHFDREKVSHLRTFKEADITMIHHPSQGAEKFYAIDEKKGEVLQLAPNSTEKQSWNLPPSDSGLYRFLPHDADLGIALANGQQILLLNEPSRRRFRRKRGTLFNRRESYSLNARANSTSGKELSFSDFRNVIERTLRDLVRRLNIQLTDISFTLADGELEDEHLQRDFTDILEEINGQKILPSETFTDLLVEPTKFSSNPAQILAARVIQVIWPVFGEIEEVHTNLRKHDHEHPTCSGIFKSLSSVVGDILHIANFTQKNETTVIGAANLTKIITRVQNFQKEILAIIDDIANDDEEHVEVLTDAPPSSPEAPFKVRLMHENATVPNPLDEPFIGEAIPERNLLAADSPYLPARGAGEIVSVKTGMAGNYRTLIAITEPKEHVIADESDSVKIYFDVITGRLFQTLSAYKPNSLTTSRIQDETLLAFVEDKSTIRVMVYRGIRGFVDVVKFKVKKEVSGLNFITLPVKEEYGCSRNFLMVSGGREIDFYKVIMAGDCSMKGSVECSQWERY